MRAMGCGLPNGAYTPLETLAALIPRPRTNLVVYHGVLALHSGWRARVMAYGTPPAVASPWPEASDTSNQHLATARGPP
jgi:hypothetical protein